MNFKQDVIEQSKTKPVIVDFFAEWCGPCRMIKPFLKESAKKHDFDLIMIDVDSNQELAREYNVRSIPHVIVFKNGKPVSKYPGGQVSLWIQTLVE